PPLRADFGLEREFHLFVPSPSWATPPLIIARHPRPRKPSAIQGLIIDGQPHLHAVVSDRERAYAGHLENGCRVLYLAEIAAMELAGGENLQRRPDERGINKITAL
ncbi:MAG: DNA-binding protein, partial [Firmicutes bacterium]|nr:DNA-binding protein [Bacillota bacterium]